MSKVAKNYAAFKSGIGDHDTKNPDHNATGIGLSEHDMLRLGFDEGETLWGDITIQQDRGVSGNFRVLCDGHHFDHDLKEEEEDQFDVVKPHEVVTVGYSLTFDLDLETYEKVLWGTR